MIESIVICLKEIQIPDCKSEKSASQNEVVALNSANELLIVEELCEVYSVEDYNFSYL